MSGKHRWILAAAMLALVFIRPQQAVDGAQRAMRMWYTGVAPAMLPFLALMPVIAGPDACRAYRKMFSGVMDSLFHLPGAAAPGVIAAMISGSPGGAAVICEIKESGGISNEDAARIALAVSGVSPAWLVLGLGCGMLGSKAAGLKLAAIQAAVQLFLLKLLEKVEIHTAGGQAAAKPAQDRKPLLSAVETVLCVCGYMAVFGAYGSVIASFAGKYAGTALMAVLDLPSGAGLIAENAFPEQMLALGGALGFGGLCIAAQNMEKLKVLSVRWRDYLAVRCISASLTALMCAAVFRKHAEGAAVSPGEGKIYVISLLAAGICAVPGMIFLSKNIFLNKRRSAEKACDPR